jgi:hypothetical protein
MLFSLLFQYSRWALFSYPRLSSNRWISTEHCLWRGANINAKTPPKAAWAMVCLPKEEGGLGVINLRVQNEAL